MTTMVIDLDSVCLVCLQSHEHMRCIFTAFSMNDDFQTIADIICNVSELSEEIKKIKEETKQLPDKICENCANDLEAVWRFQKNCRVALSVFETISSEQDFIVDDDDEGEDANRLLDDGSLKCTEGVKVKRIKQQGSKIYETEPETREEQQQQTGDIHDTSLYYEVIENMVEEEQEEEEETEHENQKNNQTDDEDLVEFYLDDQTLEENKIVSVKLMNKNSTANKKRDIQSNNTEYSAKEILSAPIAKLNKQQQQQRQQTAATNSKAMKVQHERVSDSSISMMDRTTNNKQIIKVISEASMTNQRNNININMNLKKTKTDAKRKRKANSPDGVGKPPKICELCGNSYRYQHALNAHMRRHFNDRPFLCECCDKGFVSNVELQRHMRVHTGQKPYACTYCDRRFSDFGSRIKHERTHTGERPYICSTCGKAFAYPHVLTVHVRTHTGEKKFKCQYCGKGFTKKSYLQTHMQQQHEHEHERSGILVAHNENPASMVIEDEEDDDDVTYSQMSDSATKQDNIEEEECVFGTEFVEEGEEQDEMDEKLINAADIKSDEIIQEIVEVHQEDEDYEVKVR